MGKHVAFDTETYLIAAGRVAPRLVCGSFYDGSRGALLDRADTIARFTDLIRDRDVTLILANASFDLAVMAEAGVDIGLIFAAYEGDRIYDVQTWERLRRIANGTFKFDPETGKRPSFSLAGLVEQYLGEVVGGKGGPDVWRYRYRELEGTPIEEYPPAAERYARLDAEYTYRVWAKQTAIDGEDLTDPIMVGAIIASEFALHLMSCWGIRTDKEAIDTLEASLTEHVDATAIQLQVAGLLRPTGSKNMTAIRDLVSRAYGAGAPLTEKGAISTARDVLEGSGDPALELLASVSNDQKLLTTYVPLLRAGQDRPLNPRYYLVESGRTSARNPNVQNQPRKGGVRECFVPREGWVYISADYSVCELCALAQVLLDKYEHSEMAEIIRAGQDVHLWFGSKLLGITYGEAEERRREPEIQNARQLAKIGDFGIPGGLGAEALGSFAKAYGVEMSQDEAKGLRATWLTTFPEMRQYFDEAAQETALGGGRATTTHTRTGFVRGECSFTQWCNHQFQHLVAVGARSACFYVAREAYATPSSPLFGTRPVAFIHDEIIISVLDDPEVYRPAAQRLQEVMIESMSEVIPDVPITTDVAVMSRWYKGAEAAYDDQGGLIPWTP